MIQLYLHKLQTEFITENALEHSYRPALKNLFEQLDPNIIAINEPTRSAHGSPDFVFFKKSNKNIILGYVETKDINVKLDDIEKTSQLKRYLGYSNLILTNYIEFRFFRNGEKYQTITIANREGTFLRPKEDGFVQLERELKAFLEGKPERIRSGKRLAEIMGGKAARIRENVNKYLHASEEKNKELERIYKVMKELLVHDLSIEKFADMYAQTLVYGLFVARYYDDTPENFSRQEARDLVPVSNPFLQHFFDHIIGPNFDKRLGYIVDELCEIFSIANIREIIQKHFNLFGEVVDKDPIIHFYEDFLKEYDPELRKSMGAYYTPVPVVHFIIRAIDDVLIKEFNLHGGIANTDKIQREISIQGKKTKELIHKVQILDPAVGTATFLNEIIKFIYSRFKGQEGVWSNYVEQELLPRLYGFELMMAPYTIAHLKLAMTLKETGINHFHRRLGVYLTNTLEEGIKHKDDLFSFGLTEAISEEAKAAGIVKNEKPIMVIVGNPPYSGESNNKGLFEKELEVYKQEPSGGKLKERNPKWINDDYVKFIRFAENMISKNGEGIVAMITNHGYIDNPTFRGMRWHLINSFNTIYVLDLHGNAKKKEIASDGGKDENVFKIMQGVSIIICVRRGKITKPAEVLKSDLFGKREEKFKQLNILSVKRINWEKINLQAPYFRFVAIDVKTQTEYQNGIKINELFTNSTVGIVTSRDSFVIDNRKEMLKYRITNFIDGYNDPLVKETPNFNFKKVRSIPFNEENIKQISYRPFDNRHIYFHDYFIERIRKEIMQNFLVGDNIGFMICRQQKTSGFYHILVHNNIIESSYVSNKTSEIGSSFPLYLYQEKGEINSKKTKRRSNLNQKEVEQLLVNISKYEWVDDHEYKTNNSQICPLDILDYIYSVLHSPKYREKYKEFLKIDFPRVPPAKDKDQFIKLVELGGKLRKLHLMEDPELNILFTTFAISGDNVVEKVQFNDEKVWINKAQYFGNVPKESWDFYIGGYQPAQKWLKDRKGKSLNFEDIVRYQKIIKVQLKTIEIMKKIDEV